MTDIAEGVGWDGHLLVLYPSESFRRAAVVEWVRQGLDRDARMFYVEGPDACRTASVRDVLRDRGVDGRPVARRGRVEVLPAPRVFRPGGHASLVRRALDEGHSSVGFIGDAAAGLAVLPAAEHVRFEQLVQDLCTTGPVSALCMYAQDALAGPRLDEAVELHPDGLRGAGLGMSAVEEAVRVSGEVDMMNAEVLASGLRTAAKRAGSTLRVDLSGVSFLDAVGCHALLAGTGAFRESGGRVALLRPQPPVEQVLRLVGIDRLPQIDVSAASK